MAYIATYKDGSGEITYPQTQKAAITDWPTSFTADWASLVKGGWTKLTLLNGTTGNLYFKEYATYYDIRGYIANTGNPDSTSNTILFKFNLKVANLPFTLTGHPDGWGARMLLCAGDGGLPHVYRLNDNGDLYLIGKCLDDNSRVSFIVSKE